MRMFFYFVTVISFLSSCSPKDDTPSIVGTWKIQSALFWESSGHGKGIGQGAAWKSECEKNETLIFTGEKLKKISYEKQTENPCREDVLETTYSISDGYLTYSTFGKLQSFEFKMLDSPLEIRIMLIETLSDGKKIARFYKKQ